MDILHHVSFYRLFAAIAIDLFIFLAFCLLLKHAARHVTRRGFKAKRVAKTP